MWVVTRLIVVRLPYSFIDAGRNAQRAACHTSTAMEIIPTPRGHFLLKSTQGVRSARVHSADFRPATCWTGQ
eukprot:scaffold343758_cov32-Prasinocladus_malaysianus.AAC.3